MVGEALYKETLEIYRKRMKVAVDMYIDQITTKIEGKSIDERISIVGSLERIADVLEQWKGLEDIIPNLRNFKAKPTYEVTLRENYNFFGEALEDFREQTGLTQEQLSKQTGVSSGRVSQVIHRKAPEFSNKSKAKLLSLFIIPEDKRDYLMHLPS